MTKRRPRCARHWGRTRSLPHRHCGARIAAGLLVFVDCMKEQRATLPLGPLNLETLATTLCGEAARCTYDNAAIAALVIVVGILPIILLARGGRPSVPAR